MSVYYLIFLILLLSATIEYICGKANNYIYYFCFVLLTFFLCFRYGQGTDYFGYYLNYVDTHIRSADVHGEIGWKFVTGIMNDLGIRFEILIALISLFEMRNLNKYISAFCPQKNLALLALFPTMYFTYFLSALRQGIVISAFLGILLPLYFEHKEKKFVFISLLLATIHSSALVFLLFPIVDRIRKRDNYVPLLILLGICVGVAMVAVTKVVSFSYSDSGIGFIAILERFISFAFVLVVLHIFRKQDVKCDKKLYKITEIYSFGVIGYCFLLFSSLISSRLTAPFKFLEASLYSNFTKHKSVKNIVFIYVVLISSVMLVKNINASLSSMEIEEAYSILNYPYFTIFDEDLAEAARESNVCVQALKAKQII